MIVVYIVAGILFGLIGLTFAAFGILGLASRAERVNYSDRELLWMAIAGIGDLVAAAMLLYHLFA